MQGKFVLRPSVLYLDDDGSYKSRETDGCEVTVKEMGVAGRLSGPEKKRQDI